MAQNMSPPAPCRKDERQVLRVAVFPGARRWGRVADDYPCHYRLFPESLGYTKWLYAEGFIKSRVSSTSSRFIYSLIFYWC